MSNLMQDEAYLADFQTEVKKAGGIIAVQLIMRNDMTFWHAVDARHEIAIKLVAAIEVALTNIDGKLCLFCDHQYAAEEKPGAFLLLSAGALDAEAIGCACGICQTCCGDKQHEELFKKCSAKIDAMLPTMRTLDVHPEPKRKQ
jgi:hypothetical protein